ncbi:MAG TPA: helix-turn-helix domain-containing protein [Candidatus Angelobacter sp.]
MTKALVPRLLAEYRLLALLVQHAGEVVTRPVLLMQIWGNASKIGRRADVHINGLRRRLGIYADQYIETIIGIGYRFRHFVNRTLEPRKESVQVDPLRAYIDESRLRSAR